MNAILVVDDDEDARETAEQTFALRLPDTPVEVTAPFDSEYEYLSVIQGQHFAALLLDHRFDKCASVQYRGSALAAFLRQHLVGLPIWVVSSYTDEITEASQLSDADRVISRRDFFRSDIEMKRLARAAATYAGQRDKLLSELGRLSELVATGAATPDDLKSLRALQSQIHLPLTVIEAEVNRHDLVSELASAVAALRAAAERTDKGTKQ